MGPQQNSPTGLYMWFWILCVSLDSEFLESPDLSLHNPSEQHGGQLSRGTTNGG